MSDYKWVRESGTAKEEDVMNVVLSRAEPFKYYLAYETDAFQAGRVENLSSACLEAGKLLELRLFSDKGELCCRRSNIGEVFQWRTASEYGLAQEDYIPQYQTLDINLERGRRNIGKKARPGNKLLYTTVGGEYQLPLQGNEDSVKIIAYVQYDRNGMARILDHRVCGFVSRDTV